MKLCIKSGESLPFTSLAVWHFELGNLYPEIRFVDDLRAKQTFRVAQPTVEGPIHFESASRIAARPSQERNLPIRHGCGRDG